MSNDTPYRAPVQVEVVAPAPRLVVDWTDSESLNRWKGFVRGYYALVAAGFGLAMVALASPPAAGALGAALLAYRIYQHARAVPPGFTLEVIEGVLRITRAGEAVATNAALASVRDVEVERKAIQRVSYHQNFGDAVPKTELSGDLDVARIVVVFDGDSPPVRLTEAYAPVFLCMERFGKVRSFLRRHGWKPVGERDG